MPQPTPPLHPSTPNSDTLQVDVVRSFPIRVSRAELLSSLSDDDIQAECARRGIGAEVSPDALTPEHVRGARALLDWPLHRLAAASGVSVSTIKRIEEGAEFQTRPSKHAAIRRALKAAGVRFLDFSGAAGVVRAVPAPLQQAAE